MTDRRFVIIIGKGGVGKTTVAASMALALAKEGKRVLLALANAQERTSVLFGSGPIGSEIVGIAPNIWAVNIHPERALRDYGEISLGSKTLASVLFDNKYMRVFFRAVPGIQDWTVLGKAWWHTTEKDAQGRDKYDVVLFDAPATGHGLDMLRVPKIICDVAPPGILRRDAEKAYALFKDPKACAIVLVSLPEELPATETFELAEKLKATIGLAYTHVVINGILDPIFTRSERLDLSEALETCDPASPAGAVVEVASRRSMRESFQAEQIERLSRLATDGVQRIDLPHLLSRASNKSAIETLSKHFTGAV